MCSLMNQVFVEYFSALGASLVVQCGFPGGSDGKVSACSAGDPGLIPGSGRCPAEGSGTPLQYLCLENPMDRGPGRLPSMGSRRVGHD